MASDVVYKLPYGHPCKSDYECQDQLSDSMSFLSIFGDTHSICKNGRCACDEFIQFRGFANGNYYCFKVFGPRASRHGECSRGDSNSCINGTCKSKVLDYRCHCGAGMVLIGNTCRRTSRAQYSDDCRSPESGRVPMCDNKNLMHCDKDTMKCVCYKDLFHDSEDIACLTANLYAEKYPNETLAGLGDFCGIKNNLPKICDENANMTCEDSSCKCKRKFYPVNSSGTCESKQSFAEANNLTSYKVKPGDYCYDDDDCITGLDCFKNLCACPYPCTYDNKTITCDCGEVSSTEGAAHAIWVGILGGLVIIIFWWRMIKKAIRKGKEKSRFNGNFEEIASDLPDTGQSDTHHPLPYSTNTAPSAPVRRENTTDYPLTPITIDTTNNTQPYSSPPPSYPTIIDSTRNSNPTPPPAYFTITDSTKNPLFDTPYPLNPVTGTPYPLNPTHCTGPGSSSVPNSNNSAMPISPPPPYTPRTQNDPSAPPVTDIYNPIIS